MKTLGERIKEYEAVWDQALPQRIPVIIRVDGKRFSKLTKRIKADKPFDKDFSDAMANAALETAKRIEGCVFAYTQSDEITFVLRNDQSQNSEAWLGNRIQKLNSIVASMTTANFYTAMPNVSGAYFDARTFIVPDIGEAYNVLLWRQNDAVKNSISAACYYELAKKTGKKTARKQMANRNQKQQQELLFKETSINWNDYPTKYKRGIACYKIKQVMWKDDKEFERSVWIKDEEVPRFTDREFLQNIIMKRGD